MKKTFLPLHPDKREIYAGQLAVQSKGSLLPAMEVQPKPQYIPLSFSQQRLWFIHRFEGSVQFQSIRRMMAHFKELLSSVVKIPEQPIGCVPMLSHQEVRQLLVGFNATCVAYPQDKTIISLFEEQVIKTPDNIAVVFEDEELSYNDLNERSNQLAHYLRSKGVKDGTLVPVCIERGIGMLTGILGILKSGAAYVPIDPEYPGERIRYLLEDTRSSIILSNNKNASALAKGTASLIITMDGDQPMINLQPSCNLSINIQPHHLAYVIYTSGSTGKPKGVMIEHTNLLGYLTNNKTNYLSDEAGNSGSFIHLSYTFATGPAALAARPT